MPSVDDFRLVCQPIVENLLPADSVHLLAGAPGAGKTALVADMLRKIRDGELVFGCPSHPPSQIAVIAADRAWRTAGTWFTRAGWPEVPHYSLHDDAKFDWTQLEKPGGWMRTLLQCIDRLGALQPQALVLVDPLSAFLGGDLLNYNRVYGALGELGQLCAARHLTILGTAHAGKQRGRKEQMYARPWDRILGSTALVGCADTLFYLETPYETNSAYWRVHWAPHLAPEGSQALTREANGLFVPAARSLSTVEPSVFELIDLAGVPVTTIVERAERELQLSRRTVYRQLKDLVDLGKIWQVTRGVYARRSPS